MKNTGIKIRRNLQAGIAQAFRKQIGSVKGIETLTGNTWNDYVERALREAKRLGYGITHYRLLWTQTLVRKRDECASLQEFLALDNLTVRHQQPIQALEKPESANPVLQARIERLIDGWISTSCVIRDRNCKVRAHLLEKVVISALNAPDSTQTRQILREVLRARRIPLSNDRGYRAFRGVRLNPPTPTNPDAPA